MVPRTGDVCLVTAVTDSFVPGAVAMLGDQDVLFRRWYDAYTDVLARTHLREARPWIGRVDEASGGSRRPLDRDASG